LEVAGVLIASTGMGLITVPAGRFDVQRGDVLSILCAVAFAFHIVWIGHFAPVLGFEAIALTQVATAAVLGVTTASFVGLARVQLTVGLAAAVLVTGLLATAVAFTTMAWAQQYTSANRAAVIFAIEPVIAWLTSFLVMGEKLPGRAILGAGLILAGILTVELKRMDAKLHLREGVVGPDV
jgi:drug/metabolite transporter (DMT)-like permease